MLSTLFGLLSTLAWGAGDFTGGIVSRALPEFLALHSMEKPLS